MRKIKMNVLLVSILGAFFVCNNKNSTSIYSDVELSNIEALASNENESYLVAECRKTGSVECYDGSYTHRIIYKFDRETSLY